MNTILDQEMPVQKRSRRMIFFWWSFAALLFIGLTSTFAFEQGWMDKAFPPLPSQQTAPPEQQQQNLQQEPVASEPIDEFAANSSSNQSATINQDNSVTSDDPKPLQSSFAKSSATSSTAHKVAKNNISPNSEKNLTSATAKSESYITQTPIAQTGEIAAATEEESNESNEEVLTNIQVLHRDPQDFGVTESVPVLDISYFTIPEDELGPVQASEFTPAAKRHPSINPGIEGNVLAGFNGGAGIYAGACADVKLGKRLSLTTGLGYRSFDPAAKIFPSAQADLASAPYTNSILKIDTLFDGFYVAGESINNAPYEDLDPVIESVHQWQAQAGLDWSFSRKFSLEGGFGVAFHTRAYSEYPIVPVSYINSAESRTSNSLEGYDVVRETMTSCFAGLTYHIGRHVAIKAQWMHTFQPYLNPEQNNAALASFRQRDDFIRGITFGLKYSIL